MTQLVIDVVDISGGTHPDDKVRLWAPQHRPDGERVVSTSPVDVKLVDGQATVEVLPGPARVQIMTQGVVDSAPKKVTIPDEASVTLRAVIEDGLEWEPEVINRVATLASRAESAATRAETVADTVHWQDDRLSVMGVLGPSLRGPKGDPGDGTGDGSGDVLWSELNPVLAGKAEADHSHTPESLGAAEEDHEHPAEDISDATVFGVSVLTAATAAAARQAIGAGTSNLALGTTSSTAARGNHTHTASDVGAAPASHTHAEYATTAQVEARTPEIRVVSSTAQATSPGVLYVVMED